MAVPILARADQYGGTWDQDFAVTGCIRVGTITLVSYPTGPSHAQTGNVKTKQASFELWQADGREYAFRKGDDLELCRLSAPPGMAPADEGIGMRVADEVDLTTNGRTRGVVYLSNDLSIVSSAPQTRLV